MKNPHLCVTLPAPILDRLIAEATALGLPPEYLVAAFVAALSEGPDR
jgi:hypothetical protein